MTATALIEDRTATLNALAEKVRNAITILRATNAEIGGYLHTASELYTATEQDAFYLWAQNVTGWSKQNVKNVMDSVTVLNALTAQQRAKVENWSTASIVSLVPAAKDRKVLKSVVSAIGTRKGSPAPDHVREVRNSVMERTPSTRTRKSDADRTAELAEKIRKLVERNAGPRDAADFAEKVRLMVVGAQMALDNSRLTASAIAFVGKNPAPDAS